MITLLKLLLTPTLLGFVSLAGRRWGATVSGLLIGLPLTSAPVTLILALQDGGPFAARLALGSLEGVCSLVAFCALYGWLAKRHGWQVSLLCGLAAFSAVTLALQPLVVPLALAWPLALLCVAGALRLLGDQPAAAGPQATPAWDIVVRMVVALTIVLGITAAATSFGPHLSGLLLPLPVMTAIVIVFNHQRYGGVSVLQVLHGMLLSVVAAITFFAVVAALGAAVNLGATFAAATLATLATQGGVLWLVRSARSGGGHGWHVPRSPAP